MTATGTAPARTPLDAGQLRARLAAGEPTVGTFLGMASPVAAEVCAAAGPDWVLLDLEHGGGGEEQVGATVLAAGAYGVPTVVRVETDARIRLGRVLDLGAAGVMLPRLSSAAEVAEAVRHLRYQPRGDRGVATYNRACRFGLDPGALDRADGEVLCVVQVESEPIPTKIQPCPRRRRAAAPSPASRPQALPWRSAAARTVSSASR